MAVKIRLSRIGKKGIPFYRLIAIDERRKRDGAFLEDLGTYDTVNTKVVVFHKDRYDAWISKGAVPTDSAKKIYRLYNRSVGAVSQAQPTAKKVAASE
jgi:small subunit ribosomal protein S16